VPDHLLQRVLMMLHQRRRQAGLVQQPPTALEDASIAYTVHIGDRQPLIINQHQQHGAGPDCLGDHFDGVVAGLG
jgi:hypothetical protein